jgi:hypothetical protein
VHRHRQKDGACGAFDAITILPAVFVELDIVENDEYIAAHDLVQIP